MRITLASYTELRGGDEDDTRKAVIIHLLREDEILKTRKIFIPRLFTSRSDRWSFFYSIPKLRKDEKKKNQSNK